MATWAINGPIPCDIHYVEEYHEDQSLSVYVAGDGTDDSFIEVHGLDDTVRIYLSFRDLGALIDALEGAEEFLLGEGGDGGTDCPGECGKYTGVDHLAGAANSSDC